MKPLRTPAQLIEIERRKQDKCFRFRRKIDAVYAYVRSCAVCASFLPPIDLLCANCWTEFSRLANRAEKLRQSDYPFPVYSLLTWTPQSEAFVKPFVYGFKGGRSVRAAEKLATFFLSERLAVSTSRASFAELAFSAAPSESFDHSLLWANVLAKASVALASSPYRDVTPRKGRQKRLSQTERAERRFEIRELFAESFVGQAGTSCEANRPRAIASAAKSIIFADDVITSGATAMAAYMALGDPEQFEVWTLAARPKLAGKTGVCYSRATHAENQV